MRVWIGARKRLAAMALALLPGLALAQSVSPPTTAPNAGWVKVPRAPAEEAEDKRRLDRALAGLPAERKGVVDAYVVVAALDADPVFGREAREAGRVLARRFDARGRTVVLAEDEGSDRADAPSTPDALAAALSRVAERMNRAEDVLVLYTTSHGSRRIGLAYKDARRGGGVITPARLAAMLGPFRNRLVLIQACYSGQFVPSLQSDTSVIATAASAAKSSFGCGAGNDWTFFGDALINRALREPAPLEAQLRRATETIGGWEGQGGLEPSDPQVSIGRDAGRWLSRLEKRAPKVATRPVGRSPALEN